MTTYSVKVTRQGRWWIIEIPALEEFGGLTQAGHLADVEAEARSYIAVSLDVPVDSFEVEVERRDDETGEEVTDEEGSRDSAHGDHPKSAADDSGRFYASNDADGKPLWLLKCPAEGFDIKVWSQSRAGWFPAWANAFDEVYDLTREHGTEAVTAEEADRLKSLVEDPSDEVLAHWAASMQTTRGQRWGAT